MHARQFALERLSHRIVMWGNSGLVMSADEICIASSHLVEMTEGYRAKCSDFQGRGVWCVPLTYGLLQHLLVFRFRSS